MATLDPMAHNIDTRSQWPDLHQFALNCFQLHIKLLCTFTSLFLLQPHFKEIGKFPMCSVITKPLFVPVVFDLCFGFDYCFAWMLDL